MPGPLGFVGDPLYRADSSSSAASVRPFVARGGYAYTGARLGQFCRAVHIHGGPGDW